MVATVSLSFIFILLIKLFNICIANCDECWDEYSTCEWNAQSEAYDECSKIWDEGSQYPAFVRECIEQQSGNQVECYEEAGCFEAGNQDCWWKLWEFGCSPYQCESYTICTQEFINEQGCGQQLDSCSETCQHPALKAVSERTKRRTRYAPRRRNRRKLQSISSCCECTEPSSSPFCNHECDTEICPSDSYCCNYSWDNICANDAQNMCHDTIAHGSYNSYYYPAYDYSSSDLFDYGYNSFSDTSHYPSYDYNVYDNTQDESYYHAMSDSYFSPSLKNFNAFPDDYVPSYCLKYVPEEEEEETCNIPCGLPLVACSTFPEMPPCISENCCINLLPCAADTQCVSAIHSISDECNNDSDYSNLADCIEDTFINDDEQTKINQLCNDDELCAESFAALGQCVFYECFGSNTAADIDEALRGSVNALRKATHEELARTNRIKSVQRQSARQKRKVQDRFGQKIESKRSQRQEFNEQRSQI